MDSFAIVWQYFAMFCPPGRRLVLLLALWLPAMAALCQSARPGWGSTPYHDAAGTGVTFRVWAPNATSVSVPGQFNGWSQTATPLVKELTNGLRKVITDAAGVSADRIDWDAAEDAIEQRLGYPVVISKDAEGKEKAAKATPAASTQSHGHTLFRGSTETKYKYNR